MTGIREFDDRGALWLLEDPLNLRDLLQIIEPALADRLDFARAERVNRSLIPADLKKQESDLVYLVPTRAESEGATWEVWLYVLLEHQSQHDPEMGLRLYLYMGELWDLQRREWQDRNLPAAERHLHPIIPLVFYTGTGAWSTPIDLKHLMDLPAELERFVPHWETLFLGLHRTPPEGLSEEQAGQWLRVAWFLLLLVLHRREETELAELVRRQAEQSKFGEQEKVIGMGLSIIEQAEARGEARGEAQGAEKMLRETLHTVLTTRFGELPAEIETHLADADVESMNRWLQRALTAASLEEVDILAPPAG